MTISIVVTFGKNNTRLGEVGRRHCLRIQDPRTEFQQPKTKVLART